MWPTLFFSYGDGQGFSYKYARICKSMQGGLMNHLSLFTGAGGGELGALLLGWRTIGYVEWDDYCQRVLAQRIKDGILHDAPIFSDIKTFNSGGYAASYQGLVDVISGGFPCQPFSVAGKQAGADDERNMWPDTAKSIRLVRPRYVLLENVPGIRNYLPVVISDLRRLGYTVRRPLRLGADDVGAPHRRKRVWILGYSPELLKYGSNSKRKQSESRVSEPRDSSGEGDMAHTRHAEPQRWIPTEEGCEGQTFSESTSCGSSMAYPKSRHDQEFELRFGIMQTEGRETPDRLSHGNEFSNRWWDVEPDVGRVVDGVASRVDRLKAIGNGQVPAVVRAAWNILSR